MRTIAIQGRTIGAGHPVYIVAEMSANHHQEFDRAMEIIAAAKDCGADAVKLQTYTPDTLTIDCAGAPFQIEGTLWEGRTLYDLYAEAHTPWQWQPRLKAAAENLGLALFSSPFDATAVDFLEKMAVPAYKIASPEIVDIPLLKRIAATGKPIIMSTGMATLGEIDEALQTIRSIRAKELALMKCTSAYPAPPEEMNLLTIPHLAAAYDLPVGLSDHTRSIEVPVAAVALGACIVEKHFTLSRAEGGPDSAFSLEPGEFARMVEAIRMTERAVGRVCYGVTETEKLSRPFRRSLFVVKDMKAGDRFSLHTVRSIRPGHGLHTRYLEQILTRTARRDIARGTPLQWELIA